MNPTIKHTQAVRIRYTLHYASVDRGHSECTGRQACATLLDTRMAVKLSEEETNRTCCASNQQSAISNQYEVF